MKKAILTLAAAFSLSAFYSCDKVEDLLFQPFESPLHVDFGIEPVSNTSASATLGSASVAFDLDGAVKEATENTFDGSIVGSMYLNKVAITVSNTAPGNNLSNFETISLALSTGSGTPVVLGPFTIPDGATTMAEFAVPNSPNIRSFFNGSNVQFTLMGKARSATTETLNARLAATIQFDK